MSSSASGLYPLANATRDNLAGICEALWGWSPCSQWIHSEQCQHVRDGCPCARAVKLEPFFDFYRNATAYYLPDVVGNSHSALRSHGDLRDIIALLKKKPDTPRMQLTAEHFATRETEKGQVPPARDQNRAFNLAARVVMMVQPAAENQSDGLLEAGIRPVIWHDEKSLSDFASSIFPKREYPTLHPSGDSEGPAKVRLASIMAKRLKKIAKLKIVPTGDLSSHLHLDEANGTVSIFHYTSVLKENLSARCVGSEAQGEVVAVSLG